MADCLAFLALSRVAVLENLKIKIKKRDFDRARKEEEKVAACFFFCLICFAADEKRGKKYEEKQTADTPPYIHFSLFKGPLTCIQ